MEYIIYFLLFISGVTFTKAFGFITNFGYSYAIMKIAERSSLRMLVSLSEDISFIRELKYLTMSKAGASEDNLEVVKLIDGQTMNNWKDSVIKKIIHAYPNSYRETISYNSWEGALEYLGKIAKKRD